MDKRMEIRFDKLESSLFRQSEKPESALLLQGEKLERSMNFWLRNIFGFVSYSYHSYSTTFSKGILLQVVLNGGLEYWMSNKSSQDPKILHYYQYPPAPLGFSHSPAQGSTTPPDT